VTLTDVAVGIAILVGLAGIVVPILPGTLLILVAIVVWAAEVGGSTAWSVAAVAVTLLAVGQVVKYVLPGRRLKATVPNSTLLVGLVGSLVGFFVIPVVGALVGFPVGVYVAERLRLGAEGAWPSTKSALKAMGVSILIEFVAAVLATGTWLAGVGLT
jgi:uncharacterized protein YqgC (DUF456 family)